MLDDLDRRNWRQNLKRFKKTENSAPEPELDTYGKISELVRKLEDIDAMYDSYVELSDDEILQKRLLEGGATELVKEFEQLVYSFTDEDFAEMRAAIEEYPLENFDSDTEQK